MKFLYLFLIVVFAGTCVRAQNTDAPTLSPGTGGVTGQLLDTLSQEPVGFANVTAYSVENGELVGGTTSDMDGRFTITDLPYGDYRLEVTFIGYDKEEMMLELNDSERFLRVGDITLEEGGATNLDEVVVTADRAVMELGLDRKAFNVEKSVASAGGSAEDLLRQIPSITVDLEGNVSLRGSGGVRFLINGRPSGLVGSDPATYLQSLPATAIARVEVITNPGAAFDPEGTAGIINIVLKKKRDDGFNATASLNVGTNNKIDGNLDLNWRKGRFNSFAGISGRYDERFFRGFRDQEGERNDSTFSRFFTFDGERIRRSTMLRLGTDYATGEQSTLGVQGSYQLEGGDSDNLRLTDFFNSAGELTERRERAEFEPETETDWEIQTTYNTYFDAEDHTLAAQLLVSQNDEEEIENYDEIILDGAGLTIGNERQRAPALEGRSQILAQLDYERPVGDNFKFTTGWRTTIMRLEQDAAFELFDLGGFQKVDSLSNLFAYDEDVHAVYATIGGKLDAITFNVGLRAEQAYTTSRLLEPNAETFENDYFKVYPSAFLGYAFDDNTTLQASYSRRIERPRAWALNPFVDRGDPFNLRSGNPFLLPELINSFELNVQQQYGQGTITAGLYYRQLNDLISRITRVLDGGVSLSTRENLDRGRDYGVEVIATYRPVEKLDLTVSGNAYRSEIVGNNEDESIDQNGYLFSGNVQGNYELPWGIQSQFTYFYRSPGVRPQGRIETIQSLDIGLRKEIMERRGAITVRLTDVFNTRRYRFLTETGGLSTTSQFQRESRILYVGFQYSLQQLQRERGGRRGGGGGDDDF